MVKGTEEKLVGTVEKHVDNLIGNTSFYQKLFISLYSTNVYQKLQKILSKCDNFHKWPIFQHCPIKSVIYFTANSFYLSLVDKQIWRGLGSISQNNLHAKMAVMYAICYTLRSS